METKPHWNARRNYATLPRVPSIRIEGMGVQFKSANTIINHAEDITMDPITLGLVCTAGYAILSEIIGMNPKLKSNSVVQVIWAVLKFGSAKKG